MSIYEYSTENLVTCILLPEILPLIPFFYRTSIKLPVVLKNNNAAELKAALGDPISSSEK